MMLDYLKKVFARSRNKGDTLASEVDQHISRLVEALVADGIRSGQTISIDIQASGEHPYRVTIPDEELPRIGVAQTQPLPED